MSDDNRDILNLDEMLGNASLKVRYQGKEYPLRGMRTLTPEEFGRVMAYGEKFSTLSESEIQHNGGTTIMQAVDDVLEIIAPALPHYKPTMAERLKKGYKRRFALGFQECVAVLNFWTQEARKDSPNSPRAASKPRRQTAKAASTLP